MTGKQLGTTSLNGRRVSASPTARKSLTERLLCAKLSAYCAPGAVPRAAS